MSPTDASRTGTASQAGPSLVVRMEGSGSFGAHKLRASYVDANSLRTQMLYVKGDATLQLAQLRDVLRALQPVLDFELDEGNDDDDDVGGGGDDGDGDDGDGA